MTRLVRGLTLAVVMTAVLALVAAPALAAGFNVSFEFEPVTFSDGTEGHLYVASKDKGKKTTNTTCSYLSEDNQFLGQFQSSEFTSDDPDVLKAFCLDHFVDRT